MLLLMCSRRNRGKTLKQQNNYYKNSCWQFNSVWANADNVMSTYLLRTTLKFDFRIFFQLSSKSAS